MNTVPNPSACPGHNEQQPRAGAPVWCGPCTHHLRGELGELPHLAARLLLEMENATSGGSEHVSGSKGRPIHARERYTFCIEDIDGVLDSWACVVREDRHLTAPRPTRQGPRIGASTTLLITHYEWLIAEHPEPAASEAFGFELRRVYQRAARLTRTDTVRAERCDGVICPRCDTMALERDIDWQGRATGYIICRSCETLLSAAEYERWLKMVAAPLRGRAAA